MASTLGSYSYTPENVQNIQKKVKEYLECDDILSEYITVMVRNNKTRDEIANDLSDFIGMDKAEQFLTWLWDYIPAFFKPPAQQQQQQQQQVTSPQSIATASVTSPTDKKPTQRMILSAARQAADDTRNVRTPMSEEDDKNIENNNNNNNINNRNNNNFKKSNYNKDNNNNNNNNKNKNKNEPSFTITLNDLGTTATTATNNSGLNSKKRKSINRDEEDLSISKDNNLDDDPINNPLENSITKKIKKERCQYWPLCRNGEACIYHHPSTQCLNFPNCTFGNKCLYIHPSIPCKFGVGCTNPDCAFNHPQKPAAPAMSEIPCRNGFACPNKKTGCGFYHPPPACKYGVSCNMGSKCPFGHGKPCLFGSACVTPNCTFAHHSTEQPVPDCKFGKDCTNQKCKFIHTEQREIDKAVEEMSTDQLSATLPPTPPSSEMGQAEQPAINV